MSLDIISDQNFYDPDNKIPYAELDDAIVRGVAKGLLDFSNPETYAATGAIPASATMKSLTSDLGVATVGAPGFAAISNGFLDFSHTDTGSSKALTLPDTFKLASTAKRFAAILWVKLPTSGWQTASGNVTNQLLGWMENTTTLAQWGMILTTVQATGVPGSLGFVFPATGSNGTGSVSFLSTPDTLALGDGAAHQVGVHFDGSAGSTRIAQISVDRVIKANASGAWDNSPLNTAASSAAGLGRRSPAFQAVYAAGTKLGRPSLWDLTGSSLSFADVLSRDWDAAQGYLS